MKVQEYVLAGVAVSALAIFPVASRAQVTADAPAVRPDAIVDLMTDEGVALVKGQWRYSDTRIVQVAHHQPGPDLGPSGPPNMTYDYEPHAGAADFDDSTWEALRPAQLEERRSTGRLCFNWYRIAVEIPEKIGSFDPTGSRIVFEIAVDDYAEVWVNGELPLVLGQPGGQLIKGFNAPNRVVLTRHARPGQRIQLAVFGINGPLSNPPGNFIWVRSATLEFYKTHSVGAPQFVRTEILKADPTLDEIVPSNAQLEKIAGGFLFTEGPVWVPRKESVPGYLLFSDPNNNTIYRWSSDGQVSVFRTKSGYSGLNIGEYRQPGSNGLALDKQGRLTINQHGNRRVIRVEPRGNITVLADRYDGKRLNSPNDLVYRSDGALYFTDPPFGLPKAFDDPRKELPFQGVYRLSRDGRLTLLITDIKAPNGIAFSPDEKTLYVTDVDLKRAAWLAYEVKADGTVTNGRVFFDATRWRKDPFFGPDGLKIDKAGNLFGARPGGISVFAPDGAHLGSIETGTSVSNLAWGDDGSTLYITGGSALYRVRLLTTGTGF